MIECARHRQAHGGAQDPPGVARQALAGLAQEFQAGIGEQGMRTPGALEGMADELRKALAFEHRSQMHACLDAAGECGVRRPFEGLGEDRVTDQPDSDEIARIEGEVEKSGEIAEEFGRQILSLVEDPDRQKLLGVGQMMDMRLDVAPQLGAAITRLKRDPAGSFLTIVCSAPQLSDYGSTWPIFEDTTTGLV